MAELDSVADHLQRFSARHKAEDILREALRELGASSATYYVRDPSWPGDYRLLLAPGVRVREPLYGFNAHGTAQVVLGGVDGADDVEAERYFSPAADGLALRPPPDSREASRVSPRDRYRILAELTEKNQLFGPFIVQEGIGAFARLLYRQDGRTLSSLFVNFAEPTTFDSRRRSVLRALRDRLAELHPRLMEEQAQPLLTSQLLPIFEPVQRFATDGLDSSERTLQEWLGPILQAALGAFDIIDSGFATIHLYEPETAMLRLVAHEGHIDDLAREKAVPHVLARGEGVIAWVALKRRALLIEEMGRSLFGTPPLGIHCSVRRGVNSELAVPMLAGDELVGVLNLESERPSAFWEESVRVVAFAANQMAIACRRFREVQASRETAKITKRLLRVAHEAASGRAEPAAIFRELAALMCYTLQANLCDFWQVSPAASVPERPFRFLASYAALDDDPHAYRPADGPRGDGWTAFIARTGHMVWITDITAKDCFHTVYWDRERRCWDSRPPAEPPTEVSGHLLARGIECELGIPLIDGVRGCVGVSWVKYRKQKMPSNPPLPPLRAWLHGDADLVLSTINQLTTLLPAPWIIRLADVFAERAAIALPAVPS